MLAVGCLSSMRLFAVETARTTTGCCGFVATARKGILGVGPSCEEPFTIDFAFEGAATFPAAFSFSTGTVSITTAVLSLSHFARGVLVCFRGGGAAIGEGAGESLLEPQNRALITMQEQRLVYGRRHG